MEKSNVVLTVLRAGNNINIQQAAKLSGISASYFSELEKGTKVMSISILDKLAHGFGMSPPEFMELRELANK